MNQLSPEEKYQQARERVKEEKGFFIHLISYLLVNAFFILLDVFTSRGHFWFFWPMIGWGIGLGFHWMGVFGKDMIFGKSWEEKRIQKHLRDSDAS